MEYEALDDLKEIKKDYGENMMHLCRSLFPTILEQPGLLYHVLSTNFAKSRSLYDDIVRENKEHVFKEYIYSFVDVESDKVQTTSKSVKELLAEAGYEIYECKSFFETQMFRDYYSKQGIALGSNGYIKVGNISEVIVPDWAKKEPYSKYIIVDSNGDIKVPNRVGNEELCTFEDPDRSANYYIFFIVKKNVESIRREDFETPKREDAYGVSVLCIQFAKGKKQRVSIKSRYNHTVNNPDGTYSNNLDAIIPGLTEAFEREYGFNIGEKYKLNFGLEGYVKARDGKFYKYNYRINNIYYCPNNIIIDNGDVVDTYSDKARYVFMDYFILDLQAKKLILYDKGIKDSFVDGLQNITRVEVLNKEGYKEIKLTLEENKEAIIKLDSRGRIIEYENKNLKKCGDDFLHYNETLQVLNLPNLENCGDYFLSRNESLQILDLPCLVRCGNYFLYDNNALQTLSLPNLEECGHCFLSFNDILQALSLPKLEKCGSCFLNGNNSLQTLNLPNLKECGDFFLEFNEILQTLNLPSLIRCGDYFLHSNEILQTLNLPSLIRCGNNFLYSNKILQALNLPNLKECGDGFLNCNNTLRILDLPNLEKCGSYFLYCNTILQVVNLPNLKERGSYFLFSNRTFQTTVASFPKFTGSSATGFASSLSSSDETIGENGSKGVKK